MPEAGKTHIHWLVVATALGLIACAGDGESGTVERGPGEDGGPSSVGDGAGNEDFSDAGAAAAPENPSFGGLSADGTHLDGSSPAAGGEMSESRYEADDEADTRSCYDGNDNDGDGLLDCDDTRCQGLGSCCVGHGNCCEPVDSVSLGLDDCAGSPWDGCIEGLTAFGDPEPWVEEGWLAPGGDEQFHSGLVAEDWHDPRTHRLELQAQLRRPAECNTGCVESVALALTQQQELDDETHVRPHVGLRLAGARNEVQLLVDDHVTRRYDLEGDIAHWRLVARPDGKLHVYRDGEELTDPVDPPRYAPPQRLRLAVYGRNRNPDGAGPPGARLGAIELTSSACDMPTQWQERQTLTLTGTGDGFDVNALRAPSIARHDGRSYLVFEHGGAIWVAEQVDGEAARYGLVGNTPALQSDVAGVELTDPDLLWDPAAGEWVLYYSRIEGTDRTIHRASAEVLSTGFGNTEEVLRQHAPYTHFDAPTVVRHEGTGEVTWILIARGWRTGGHGLVPFHSSDGRVWHLVDVGDLASFASSGASSGPAAMADEITDPSLVVHNGAWQLHYAQREGTRWSIRLLASHELLWWRPLGEVFGPSALGHDKLGTRSPDMIRDEDSLTLVYAGHDGVHWRLARASRPASDGTF